MNTTVYAQRLGRAKSLLHAQGLDYLLVGPSADMFYLVGTRGRVSERLSLLVIPQEGPTHLVVPAFEAASNAGTTRWVGPSCGMTRSDSRSLTRPLVPTR